MFFRKRKYDKQLKEIIKNKDTDKIVIELFNAGWELPKKEEYTVYITDIVNSEVIGTTTTKSHKQKKTYTLEAYAPIKKKPKTEWLIYECNDYSTGTWHIDYRVYRRNTTA